MTWNIPLELGFTTWDCVQPQNILPHHKETALINGQIKYSSQTTCNKYKIIYLVSVQIASNR